jgi:hypothetical protein
MIIKIKFSDEAGATESWEEEWEFNTQAEADAFLLGFEKGHDNFAYQWEQV